jgi:hypothetical protein
MRKLFLFAVVIGFAGTLAAAHFVPWVTHDRLPSQTSVVANGGRAEEFLIRLPADRIAATDGPAGTLRSASDGGAMVVPAKLATAPLLIEHFKVRDSTGQVIGVAARHWTSGERGATTVWSVLIPARGSLLLRAPGEPTGVLQTALQRAGYTAGSAWEGNIELAFTGPDAGTMAAGTGEFEGLAGTYTETWKVAGIDTNGELRGTIELYTVTRAP